jgi:hypothetical protein
VEREQKKNAVRCFAGLCPGEQKYTVKKVDFLQKKRSKKVLCTKIFFLIFDLKK